MTERRRDATDERVARTAARWTGLLLGIGLMGALDEIIFHQLLQWHHFYVHTTDYWRIVSDGLFHIFTTTLLFWGAVRLWRQRHLLGRLTDHGDFWAGVVPGAGAFQLFDGLINHKLLQLHPVRENVDNILPYDVGWNLAGLLLLLVGILLWQRSRREQPWKAKE